MKIITINLPEPYLRDIAVLNELGVYPSRSEVIRMALRDFLTKELEFHEDLDEENFKMLARSSLL